MIKNYLKIAWRNLFRNKVYSAINILGLALGMAMALIIGLWISDEFNINKNFAHYDRVIRVKQNSTSDGNILTIDQLPLPLANEMRTRYASDFKNVAMLSWAGGAVLSYGNTKIGREGCRYAEPGILDIFSIHLIKGGKGALNEPASLIIDEALARDLFGKTDPLNKIIKVDNKTSVRITGVYENLPRSSFLSDAHFLFSWSQMVVDNPEFKVYEQDWIDNGIEVYAQLSDHADLQQVSGKIKTMLNGHGRKDNPELLLEPMSRWHLYADYKNGKNAGGAIEFVRMFGIIGFFVLLLACINFMNLSTARSERRAREVGIRKSIGSLRYQLIGQFLGESLMIAGIAVIFSLIILFMVLPWFNQVADKEIIFPWNKPIFWLSIFVFTIVTGLIAGSYPAFYLSSFDAVKVLKGTMKAGRFVTLPRKILVVLQFTISITLIVGTLVVFQEIQFARNRSMGYEMKGLLTVYRGTPESMQNYEVLRHDLIANGGIEDMALSLEPTTRLNTKPDGWNWPGKDPNINPLLGWTAVSQNFGSTVKWEFIQGRDFSNAFLSDSNAIILNETAVKYMGMKHPIGTLITSKYSQIAYKPMPVIGVIKDMIVESPFAQVTPTIYSMNLPASNLSWITFKLNHRLTTSQALGLVTPLFNKYIPAAPFDINFNDQTYAKNFMQEQRIGTLSLVFASFAIFISCLGLFGLSSFTAEQRTREIGVRKVLGASVMNLWTLLSKEFLVLVSIALFIALPVSYYLMNNWLQRYTFRISISTWIFIGTIGMSLFITLVTVSFQSIRASLANPVKSLRSE